MNNNEIEGELARLNHLASYGNEAIPDAKKLRLRMQYLETLLSLSEHALERKSPLPRRILKST